MNPLKYVLKPNKYLFPGSKINYFSGLSIWCCNVKIDNKKIYELYTSLHTFLHTKLIGDYEIAANCGTKVLEKKKI